jgi:tetratricopeptide (TPR) repeat protein
LATSAKLYAAVIEEHSPRSANLEKADEQNNGPFISLLDIDPHERLGLLEQQIAGTPPDELLAKGLSALGSDTLLALVCLERAFIEIQTPELESSLGFCLAKERAQFGRAIELCRAAIDRDRLNPRHYLLLGRVFLMQGKKNAAIEIYHEGLKHAEDPEIRADLKLVGSRRRPVIPILHREHILNRSLGFILNKISRKLIDK